MARTQLSYEAGPPEASIVVMIGGQLHEPRVRFRSCRTVGHLDNRVGVDNAEQGQPIAVWHRPVDGWGTVWPALRHLD